MILQNIHIHAKRVRAIDKSVSVYVCVCATLVNAKGKSIYQEHTLAHVFIHESSTVCRLSSPKIHDAVFFVVEFFFHTCMSMKISKENRT